MNTQKGFTPMVIAIIAIVVIGLGVGSYVFLGEKKSSTITSSDNAPLPGNLTEAPEELLGWWEVVESWSVDSQTGGLKKNESDAFSFLREFTDKYFCTQYSAKFTCANNILYSVNGNKISLEGSANFYEWRIVDGQLELVSKDSKGRVFDKTLSKKIGPPTSTTKIDAPAITRPEVPASPKAKLRLVKVSQIGICLKHEGGDPFSVTDLAIGVGNMGWGINPTGSFPPPPADYVFDPGEAWVYSYPAPGTFKVGDRFQAAISGEVISPLKSTGEEDFWVVEKIVEERGLILIGGFASCP